MIKAVTYEGAERGAYIMSEQIIFKVSEEQTQEPSINIGFFSSKDKAMECVEQYAGTEIFNNNRHSQEDMWFLDNFTAINITEIALDVWTRP